MRIFSPYILNFKLKAIVPSEKSSKANDVGKEAKGNTSDKEEGKNTVGIKDKTKWGQEEEDREKEA